MSPNTRWSNFRNSFQFKLLLVFTIITFLVTCLLSVLYIVKEVRSARRHATERLLLRAKILGETVRLPLYAHNREALRRMAEEAAQATEIHGVVISAPDGSLLAEYRTPNHPDKDDVIVQTIWVNSNMYVDSIESSLTGGRDAITTPIGIIRMERGTADLSDTMYRVIAISTCVSLFFWLLVSLFCHLVLRRVTASFNVLVGGIRRIQEGDFTTCIDIASNDEPGRIARAINTLAFALQQRSEENARLVEERIKIERKMLHAQKLESLGVMAGGIAHDYNNLLQSILGNIELAAMKIAPDAPPQKYITNAINSGKHAAHLTGLMLTYVGKGFVTKKALNLNNLVVENAGLLKTAASSAVSTELLLAPDLPEILADEAHIQQLVMNLIINAAESIEGQPGIVKIKTGTLNCGQECLASSLLDEKPAPGRFAFLEIEDNGCGMNSETLTCLFDPFFTTKFTGRGLGMSAVLGIVRTHGGALFVESEPGKGTIFRVLFPVSDSALPAADQEQAAAAAADTTPKSPLSGVALVVDDERSVLKIGKKMLEVCGFTVLTACDGIEAVAAFREHADEISVVLMDLTMPNMDGIAAMGEIYGIKPDSRVILSSGFSEEELNERITNPAPDGFIRKPYSVKVLESEIRRVLQTPK